MVFVGCVWGGRILGEGCAHSCAYTHMPVHAALLRAVINHWKTMAWFYSEEE